MGSPLPDKLEGAPLVQPLVLFAGPPKLVELLVLVLVLVLFDFGTILLGAFGVLHGSSVEYEY